MTDLTREELIALVVAQREIIARLEERIRELEAQIHKDSHNSHIPPSRSFTPIKNMRKKTGKKKGGQKGHKGKTLEMVENPFHNPAACMIAGDGFLGFDFLTTFLDMGNVGMCLYDRVTCITLVGAEVLFGVLRRQDDTAIENGFKLCDIMSVGPCDDYRHRTRQDIGLFSFRFQAFDLCKLGISQGWPRR